MAQQIKVTVPVPALSVFGKAAQKEVLVNADEIHISTNGVLCLKRYGNIVQVFAHGEWLKASK